MTWNLEPKLGFQILTDEKYFRSDEQPFAFTILQGNGHPVKNN